MDLDFAHFWHDILEYNYPPAEKCIPASLASIGGVWGVERGSPQVSRW